MRPRASKGAAVLGLVALVATGCGSRLSEDQVSAYAGADQAVGGVGGDGGQEATGGPTPAGGTDPTGTGSADAGATTAGATTDGGDGGAAASTSPQSSSARDGGDDAGGTGGEQSGSDTRAAPAGGNGGSTDVGVTGDTITIYNVADLSGAVPGLFRDAMQATQAYVAYFTATEGTVYGRRIEFVSRDTGLSSNGNRSAYLDACKGAFAVVGSMSAFEDGAAEPIRDCGVPDLRATPTSKALQDTPESLGVIGLRSGEVGMGEWTWYREKFPDAVEKAAYVFVDNTTTQYQANQNMAATEGIGYRWVAEIPVAVSETNYARIVTELRNSGAQFVTFMGAYQQAARLVEAMDQQDYQPEVYHLQANIYSQEFLQTCGALCDEYTHLAQTGALLEEMDSNPELQRYAEWLARVNPQARPTGLGMYSWSAAKLFVEALKEIGPRPTRAKLLEYLGGVDDYDADGLIPPQHVGTQEPAGCVVMLDIEDGRYVRIDPAKGYRCRSPATV